MNQICPYSMKNNYFFTLRKFRKVIENKHKNPAYTVFSVIYNGCRTQTLLRFPTLQLFNIQDMHTLGNKML